jgi:hypothetical protein
MSVSMKHVRKGTSVKLRNGWTAQVEDNQTRGHARLATVYGDYTEMGSVYATDIVEARMPDGSWQVVAHSPAALKVAAKRTMYGLRSMWGF